MWGFKVLLQAALFAVVGTATANALTFTPVTPGNSAAITADTVYYNSSGTLEPGYGEHLFYFTSGALTDPILGILFAGSGTPGAIADLTFEWWNDTTNALIASLGVTGPTGAPLALNPAGPLVVALAVGTDYYLKVAGTVLAPFGSYNFTMTTTPLPPAVILFGSALAGLSLLGRRSRRRAKDLS